jgi:hypothetical protein
VFDTDMTNADSTAVGPLVEAPDLLPGPYGCVILMHVLHQSVDPTAVLEGLRAVLLPGGVLLASVPAVARRDSDRPDEDFWRFSAAGFERRLRAAFDGDDVQVIARGNRDAVTAFLAGLAADDLERGALERDDPSAPLVVLARAVRSGP